MERWLESFANAIFLRSSDTAHDLKTPLNIAVLNLELLRMRVRKLTEGVEDEKLNEYAHAIETELRRMARIFDTFFVLSTPPRAEGTPKAFNAVPMISEAAEEAGYGPFESGNAMVCAHEARIRQALKMFLDGASRLLKAEGRRLQVGPEDGKLRITVSGTPAEGDELELSRVFKFYYTDALGNPDVSLAAARLIAETYGGEALAVGESDKVTFQLLLPLGEQ